MQPDPTGTKGGINLYNHVSNDPLNVTDPTGDQEITPDAMDHILNAHGWNTPRTRPGNSIFNSDVSNPSALQDLSNGAFASPLAPPVPWNYGGLYEMQGASFWRDNDTGDTYPNMIGIDENGSMTNQFILRYDPVTNQVKTMFPVPMYSPSIKPQGSLDSLYSNSVYLK